MDENEFIRRFAAIKRAAGGHSPSIATMRAGLGFEPRIDACYLSNPCATDIVAGVLRERILGDGLSDLVDRYPSQSWDLRPYLTNVADVSPDRLVVCNGVAEIISYLLGRRPGTTLLSVPTFSAYHQYASGEVVEHRTLETDQRRRADAFLDQARAVRPTTAVVINPNNPDGFTYETDVLDGLVAGLSEVCEQVIVDESFAGLVFPRPLASSAPLVDQYPNVAVLRSLSKEYGIAGLRLGYAALPAHEARSAYDSGFLWNVNAFGESFLRSLASSEVVRALEDARHEYLRACADFIPAAAALSRTRLASRTNFTLIEVPEGQSAAIVAARLAFRHGIYVRSCEDKIGLTDAWLRVAARRPDENALVLPALEDLLGGTENRGATLAQTSSAAHR